jgi:hypothetical protein
MKTRIAALLLAAVNVAAAQSTNAALDRMVARLAPMARGVSEQFDAMAQRVRRDSGTARADSTAYQFWRRPWVVTRRLDTMSDAAVLAALAPEAAADTRDSLMRLLVSGGVHPYFAEGAIYFALSASHMQQRISCCVSAAMREYLAMEQESQAQAEGADGSILISLDDLIGRMVRNEQYLTSYPSSVALAEVTYHRDRRLAWLIYGIDNSPAFNFRTKDLLPNYRRVIELLASTRPSEHSGKAAQAMLDLLKTNGYRRTPAVDAHIQAQFRKIRPPQ